MLCNEMPTLKVDTATMRRIRAFPFDAQFRFDDPSAENAYDPEDITHFVRDPGFKKSFPVNGFLGQSKVLVCTMTLASAFNQRAVLQ